MTAAMNVHTTPHSTPVSARRPEDWVGLGASISAIFAILMPWATVNFFGAGVSINGIDTGDGKVALALSGICATTAVLTLIHARSWSIATLLVGLCVVALAIYEIANIGSKGASISVGSGLYLLVTASLILCVAAAVATFHKRPGEATPTIPAAGATASDATEAGNVSSWTCRSCNAESPPSASFCGDCGAGRPIPNSLCGTCGASSIEGARFCGSCGARAL